MSEKYKNTKRSDLNCLTMASPVGELLLVADEAALMGVYFAGRDHVPANSKHWKMDEKHPILKRAMAQLMEYFAGKRKEFDLPLPSRDTGFQERVWMEIARIPFGETLTYTELAKRAGSPGAIRAAGASTGANPISIIIPCHRVMGKNGKLTGFAGGLERKEYLLRLEGNY